MKKLLLPALGLAATIGFSSCSEDFKVAAPYKNITVISGTLNQVSDVENTGHVDDVIDSVQYIRIQKAFMDENKSAIDMSKVSDSSFYPENVLDVRIKEIGTSGSVISEVVLPRVDLNNEGFKKKDGSFFTTPNYAYKYSKKLNINNTYRLVVTNKSTGEIDSATTTVITNNSDNFKVSQFQNAGFAINFVDAVHGGDGKFSLTFLTPANSYTYQGVIRFRWTSKNVATGTETVDSSDWNFATSIKSTQSPSAKLEVNWSNFFTFIAGAMGPAPDNVLRYMGKCDVYVWAGDTTIYNYQQFAAAQGGLAGDQIRPVYTNMRSNVPGTYPVGIFGSRSVVFRKDIQITPASIDELKKNNVTLGCKIQG